MKVLSHSEVQAVNGAWIGFVFAAARLGFAIYRHHRHASIATWAGRGVATVGGTYQGMAFLEEHRKDTSTIK